MPEPNELLDQLPAYADALQPLQEMLLTNLVMVGEIPAPTFGEEGRVRFMQDRFTEAGLQNVASDEIGNATAILPGAKGDRNILLVAHADTTFPAAADHTVNLETGTVSGLSIGRNAMGLAALMTLPDALGALGLELDANLILLGAVRSVGRGDLAGVRFFLEHSQSPIEAGLSIEGMQLGRLSYSSIGMIRGEIVCQVPEEYDWTKFGAFSAIQTLNEVIDGLMGIALPRKPRTTIILGQVEGGRAYDIAATEATLRLEVRSEAQDLVEDIRARIEDICSEVAAHTGAEVTADFFASRRPGGMDFSHPLAHYARRVHQALTIEPRVSSSLSEISAFTDRGIPALRLALTRGETFKNGRERLEIPPMFKGLAQLVGVLLAIDNGICHEDR
ncbi:MAG: peptidase dimerization domain-containing protein [Planctomycetota bacterium]